MYYYCLILIFMHKKTKSSTECYKILMTIAQILTALVHHHASTLIIITDIA
jgi:hypothetical protein